MKKFLGALLLLPLVLMVMVQFAAAQDTMSAILSTPYNSRPGSQIIYYFNQGTWSGADTYRSYLTITNLSPDTAVLVHYQFYNIAACAEVFDYVDILTPQDTTVIDPSNLVTINGSYRGQVDGGRFLLTATAVDATLGQGVDTRAISFNFLSGQQFITNLATGSSFGGNAVTRMAVNALGGSLDAGSCYTTPKDFPSFPGKYAIGDYTFATTGAWAGCNTSIMQPVNGFVLTGYTGNIDGQHVSTSTGRTSANADEYIRLLQMFRPAILAVNHFFAPGAVDAANNGNSNQFGNRLTLVSVEDKYDDNRMFKLASATTTFTPWFIDNNEQPFSLPTRSATCVTEYVLSPRTVGGVYAGTATIAGIGSDFIGSGIYAAANEGGWIKLVVTTAPSAALSNWFGWFSQSVGDPNNGLSAGVGDLLIGLGRVRSRYDYDSSDATDYYTLQATEAYYDASLGLTATQVQAQTITP